LEAFQFRQPLEFLGPLVGEFGFRSFLRGYVPCGGEDT